MCATKLNRYLQDQLIVVGVIGLLMGLSIVGVVSAHAHTSVVCSADVVAGIIVCDLMCHFILGLLRSRSCGESLSLQYVWMLMLILNELSALNCCRDSNVDTWGVVQVFHSTKPMHYGRLMDALAHRWGGCQEVIA